MALSAEVTRRIISVVLEQGQKVGLDVAGSFLGPAWPFVRPLIEGLLKGLPKNIADRYKNSEEALEEALRKIEARDKEVALIGEALAAHGVDEAWARAMTEQLDGLSDDVFEVLCRQAEAGADLRDVKQQLTLLLDIVRRRHGEGPAQLVLRATELEYVDLLRVPDGFLPGYDLTPAGFAPGAVSERHVPAGFLVLSFSLLNAGDRPAVVGRIQLDVRAEGECPPGSRYDELKPTLDPFEDQAALEVGAAVYPLFRGKRFAYEPDQFDAFRVQLTFVLDGQPRWQQLRPAVHWSDATGEHVSYGRDVFLASHPKPQLDTARRKFGVVDG